MLCCKSSSKIAKRSSSCFGLACRAGFRGVVVDGKCARRFRFIVLLLGHRNGLGRLAHLHAERSAGSSDAEIVVAEPADQVERLLCRLLLREPERVGLDLGLDRSAHLRSSAEIAIRRHAAVDALMRSLEVVVLDVELQPTKAVGKVGEHRLG